VYFSLSVGEQTGRQTNKQTNDAVSTVQGAILS